MGPSPRRLIKGICSSASEPTPSPSAVSAAASVAAAAVLRTTRFESSLLSLLTRALLLDPSCVRLTLSRILSSHVPAFRFLRSVSSHHPAPDAAPDDASPPLHGLDAFLLRLPPPLATEAAGILASHFGLHPSVPALNAASRIALNSARPDLVFHLFNTFSSSSSSPAFPGDASTVDCLVRACVADGRPLDGLRLLRDAARRGFPPSPDAVGDLVGAFTAAGNFGKVSDTFHLMIASGCLPNTIVYQRLIHGLFRRGMGDEALRIFNEIKLRGYNIDAITYMTVMDGFCKMGREAEAWQVCNEMQDKGMELDQYGYCSLIHYYYEIGDFGRAQEMHDEMLDKGFHEDTVSSNITIAGFCAHGRVDKGFDIFEEMVTKGIKHDVITYTTLIQGLCKVGRLTEAVGMFEHLLSSGLEPSVLTFTPLIDTMCEEEQVDDAVELVRRMQDKGLNPLVRSNDSIIDGFCKVKRAEDAMAWLAGMLKNNLKPREQTFNSLIMSLTTAGQVDDALLILSLMFKIGFSLSRFCCTALVNKLCADNISYSHGLEEILASN